MRRALPTLFLSLSLLGACAARGDCGEDVVRRPNVLVVYADQWRASALGCDGNPDVRTPHIDRLAAEGVFYERSFVNVPLCTPSRAMLLTGRYPLSNGVLTNHMSLPPDEATLARLLNDAGYQCG